METFIQKLEILSYDSLVDWLASALAGKVALSGGITRDQGSAADLFHLFKDLQGHLTLPHSIKRAICELLDRFAASPDWEGNGYQKQLLLLAGFMQVTDTAARLRPLVQDQQRFIRLDPVGRTFVMNILHDLPGSEDPTLWKIAAKADPVLLGSIAFSALLTRHLVRDALSVLQLVPIPDDPITARTLATKLRLATPNLPDKIRKELILAISNLLLPGKPLILDGFKKWLETQPVPEPIPPVSAPRRNDFFERVIVEKNRDIEVPRASSAWLKSAAAAC